MFRCAVRVNEIVELKLFIEPDCQSWGEHVSRAVHHDGSLAGRTMAEWKAITRRELGLATDRPIVATGHQTLLWHPGILAKYLAVDAFVAGGNGKYATANLIVDQHADGFGSFEIPVRKRDGSFGIRQIELTRPRPGVPMGLHESFEPESPPSLDGLNPALPSVSTGVETIYKAVAAHANEANAARQMAAALNDLMRPWAKPTPAACASAFVNTQFGRALLEKIVDDPQLCARLYNEAVAAVPDAGVGPLLVRDDYVELPLWRIREDGARMHAYDSDVEKLLDGDDIKLMPRALFMTALLRLVVCDLFVHGKGGANYDRAMELWARSWLDLDPCPIAVVSADVLLPLRGDEEESITVDDAILAHRKLWHEPAGRDAKAEYIKKIAAAPRRSAERKRLYLAMQEELEKHREARADDIKRSAENVERARRMENDRAIALRRDWAFPLYPRESIDALASAVGDRLNCAAGVG